MILRHVFVVICFTAFLHGGLLLPADSSLEDSLPEYPAAAFAADRAANRAADRALSSSSSVNLMASSPWARDYGGTMWKLEGSRKYEGESYGSWAIGIRAKADGGAGDSISMSSSKSVSNSISGNVGIPIKKLNTSFQFNVSRQWSASASKSYGLTGKKKGSWWAIQYKRVYNKYKIRARQYSFYDGTWHKTTNTKWIRAKRFTHFAYQLCPSSAPN